MIVEIMDTWRSRYQAARHGPKPAFSGGSRNAETKVGIGTVARDAIRKCLTNEEALREVLSTFPAARTSIKCIKWYRHGMRKAGEDVPTEAEAKLVQRRLSNCKTVRHLADAA
jgi:hypothetical protein